MTETPSIIQRPDISEVFPKPKRKTVFLMFKQENHPLNGEYDVRGGICWPQQPEPLTPIPYGFAVIVLQDVKTGVAWVFEEQKFTTIQPIMTENHEILMGDTALMPFLRMAHLCYNAYRYHFIQPDHIHKKYFLQILRAYKADPGSGEAPWFVDVPWGDKKNEADQSVWERVGAGRLKSKKDGPIFNLLKQDVLDRDRNHPAPEMIALMSALAGIDCSPWRQPRED